MIAALTHWESYYVIVGSSAAALTGLQFVVIALIAESPLRVPSTMRQVSAFGTPNVVHFSAVLLIAAIVTAPWTSMAGVAWTMTVVGLAGTVYGLMVIRRARVQEEYRPVLSDWIWHTVLPLAGYASILLGAMSLWRSAAGPLFVIGAAALLLLFIGIHNSWDTVTYIAISQQPPRGEPGPEKDSRA
jgi:hypothetical protein